MSEEVREVTGRIEVLYYYLWDYLRERGVKEWFV